MQERLAATDPPDARVDEEIAALREAMGRHAEDSIP
jgi:hypothetical protein